jgi:hypothetical protein
MLWNSTVLEIIGHRCYTQKDEKKKRVNFKISFDFILFYFDVDKILLFIKPRQNSNLGRQVLELYLLHSLN